jgi:hypothetical protein
MSFSSDLTFTLGKNNKGDNPKRPDYRGEAIIGGRTYKLSGWIRENKAKGTKFISGRMELVEPQTQQQAPDSAPPAANSGELKEDVPF